MPLEVMCGEVGCHRGLAHLGRGFLYPRIHAKSHLQQLIWTHQKTQGERRWESTCQNCMGETCLEPGAFLTPVAGEGALRYALDSQLHETMDLKFNSKEPARFPW